MTIHTPPTVIAFASPKGGVGKSTSCLAIAGALASLNAPTTIIDFDATETLYRWYSNSPKNIPNLIVEKGPATLTGDYLTDLWNKRTGYVLLDLAGTMTNQMIALTTFAAMTITPAKLSEPDIVEAIKLHQNIAEMSERVGKPVIHKILLNDVPHILAGYQGSILDQLRGSDLNCFETMLRNRAAYAEVFLTFNPPHAADRTRPAIAKAVDELDDLLREILNTLTQEQKAAA